MLYKVAMITNFAESSDRIGIIEAQSIGEAARKLIKWRKGATPDLDTGCTYSLPTTSTHFDLAEITYNVEENGRHDGCDTYIIRPIGSDTLMFLAQDWNLIFE